jgi:hypothetical protein
MTKTPLFSVAILVVGLTAFSGEAAAAPIAPSSLTAPSFRVPGAQHVTFRKRYYREYAPYGYAPYSYYAPPVVTYWAPPIYGYAAPPPVYYAPPVVYAPPIRQYYGPNVYYEADYYRPRGFAPYYTGW